MAIFPSVMPQHHNYSEGSYTHENHMFEIKSLKRCKYRF